MASASSAPQDDGSLEEVEEGGSNCLVVSLGSFISGGVLGSVVGLAGGVFKRQGFKVAMAESMSSAKTFALMSGVHSLVSCAMTQWRKTDDVVNQAVAGCASGIALGVGGPPTTMLVNCAGFAGFAFVYEFLTAKSALAAASSPQESRRRLGRRRSSQRCELPICRALKLNEVLSLGIPCWLFQDKGCSIDTYRR